MSAKSDWIRFKRELEGSNWRQAVETTLSNFAAEKS